MGICSVQVPYTIHIGLSILLLINFILDNRFFLAYISTMLILNTKLIHEEMRRRGLTQADIARKWKVSPQAVSQVFKRRPITFADAFAKLLKVDAKSLIEQK